ncbi:MAG: hypothetical protein GY842_26290 [bacterium]|nr:hypothetical protein [bacterium]
MSAFLRPQVRFRRMNPRDDGLKRLCLGEGRNGIVRFLRKEVEAYEASRQV